jgi:hypothetical protein
MVSGRGMTSAAGLFMIAGTFGRYLPISAHDHESPGQGYFLALARRADWMFPDSDTHRLAVESAGLISGVDGEKEAKETAIRGDEDESGR